jgi:shikimate dehydrogenase
MQNAAFDAAGIECRYVLHGVSRADLPKAIAHLRADRRILGANVTIPHKESVIPLLDELDPLAAHLGAVNTISRRDNRLKGWNTDVEGFRRALDECGYAVGGRAVAIIGAGGAARAVALALKERALHLSVIARNIGQAQRLCRDLGIEPEAAVDIGQVHETLAQAEVVVNATPADLPPRSWLRPDQRVFDLRPRRSIEGRTMLLYQGIASFQIWTDTKAPVDAMRAALEVATVAVPA